MGFFFRCNLLKFGLMMVSAECPITYSIIRFIGTLSGFWNESNSPLFALRSLNNRNLQSINHVIAIQVMSGNTVRIGLD